MSRPTFVLDTGMVCGQHLALCIDQDSREVVGLQVAHDAADAVSMALSGALVACGLPETVVVDNGPAFGPAARLCLRLGIGIERVTPYNPQPKATERAFRDVRGHLADMMETV